MSEVLIINTPPCHYEILESCILKIRDIFNVNDGPITFTLVINKNDTTFKKYIIDKYSDNLSFTINIYFVSLHEVPTDFKFSGLENIINKNYDHILFATLLENEKTFFNTYDLSKTKYISHTIMEYEKNNNQCIYLTPLGGEKFINCDILPYTEDIKIAREPIYIIQGNLTSERRDYNIIKNILDMHIASNNNNIKFTVKFVGRGQLPKILDRPEYKKYISLKNNLCFIDYHKEFLDAYCIIPLISKQTHPQYYNNKLTSSINYGKAYNLWFLLDHELQQIYNLPKVFEYNYKDITIYDKFLESLLQFYNIYNSPIVQNYTDSNPNLNLTCSDAPNPNLNSTCSDAPNPNLNLNFSDVQNGKYNDVAFITLTNSGYVDISINCIKSLNNINYDGDIHCYCIGSTGYHKLINNGINATLIDEEENSSFQVFRTDKWSNVVYHKFNIIHDNLQKYKYVCITDGDIVYENNEFMEYLLKTIENYDMLIQNDTLNKFSRLNLCSGFMFLKSNKCTLKYFSPKNIEMFKNCVGWGDQKYINIIKYNLKYKMLPLELFPNGAYYFKFSNRIKPYLIHFNWLKGSEKQNKMKEYNKWYVEQI